TNGDTPAQRCRERAQNRLGVSPGPLVGVLHLRWLAEQMLCLSHRLVDDGLLGTSAGCDAPQSAVLEQHDLRALMIDPSLGRHWRGQYQRRGMRGLINVLKMCLAQVDAQSDVTVHHQRRFDAATVAIDPGEQYG